MNLLILLVPALFFVCPTLSAQPLPISQSVQGKHALQAEDLAVIVNDDDPHSVEVADYYLKARGIPAKNVVHVRIPGSPSRLSEEDFKLLKEAINAKINPAAQAIVMVWTAPYAVRCNSITSAVSLGYDAGQCANTCAPGKPSRYFNAMTARPFSKLDLRPSMLLPTDSIARAKALIDRGIQRAFRLMPASAYFLTTSDAARNSRAQFFPRSQYLAPLKLRIRTSEQESLANADDIMLYQTGTASVAHLNTLRFRPGALADHLTSSGGELYGTSQMSSLRWLEAGATASYGTVSEPCNYWQKFPNSAVLLEHYLRGDTAIEAYWKSVAWPAQGVFIGEPLAAPYRR